MTIRPYTPSDLQDVLDAWEAASRLAHPFLGEAFLARERESIKTVFLPQAETWVVVLDDGAPGRLTAPYAPNPVVDDGRVAGFIALIDNEIGGLFVHPRHHGKGLGWALVEHALGRHAELVVEVFRENQIGRRFYARAGFTVVDELTHEETGQPLLRLRLRRPAGVRTRPS